MQQLKMMPGYSAILLILLSLTAIDGFLETQRRTNYDDLSKERNFFGNTLSKLSERDGHQLGNDRFRESNRQFRDVRVETDRRDNIPVREMKTFTEWSSRRMPLERRQTDRQFDGRESRRDNRNMRELNRNRVLTEYRDADRQNYRQQEREQTRSSFSLPEHREFRTNRIAQRTDRRLVRENSERRQFEKHTERMLSRERNHNQKESRLINANQIRENRQTRDDGLSSRRIVNERNIDRQASRQLTREADTRRESFNINNNRIRQSRDFSKVDRNVRQYKETRLSDKRVLEAPKTFDKRFVYRQADTRRTGEGRFRETRNIDSRRSQLNSEGRESSRRVRETEYRSNGQPIHDTYRIIDNRVKESRTIHRDSNRVREGRQDRQIDTSRLHERRVSDSTRRLPMSSKDNLLDMARQSKFSERRMATSFNTEYIPQLKTNFMTNTVQVILLTLLLAQVMNNSSKIKRNWFQNWTNFVTVTKEKVL